MIDKISKILYFKDMEMEQVKFLITEALKEDLQDTGDVTSEAVFAAETGQFILWSKDTGILAGLDLFKAVFRELDDSSVIEQFSQDGDQLQPGIQVARVVGKVLSVLKAERVALNFLATLSGIATKTGNFVRAARAGGGAVILDTRKTLPGYRYLSKYAVRIGGGENHRMGLYDMVMLKDNHIDAAGGITRAVGLVRARWQQQYKIEVECRTLQDVAEALDCGVDLIMLDNMHTALMKEAVDLVGGRIKLEASGNMTLELVKEVSGTGVDYISVGAITKSVKAFDFSLKLEQPHE